jgi:molybdenum cofactor synthesis domain-containing protein
MRPFTSTIPFDDARRLTMDAAVPVERTETIFVADADGRVLGRDVTAAVDVPPFDRAMMDGYAVQAADTVGASADSPAILTCVGTIFAGQGEQVSVGQGECAEIATGAPLPPGADAVVMVEQTSRDANAISIVTAATPGQNIGVRAGDLRAGALIATAGTFLTPALIGALAGTGLDHVDVFVRPTVALISTGNEIVEPGQPLGTGQIYDVNRLTLAALVRRHGGTPVILPLTSDSLDETADALTRALTHDVVVFSGGSSVGDRDLVMDVLRERGEVLYHGIAVKPGKPTALARIDGRPVFAMPGNPTSCLSNGYLLLVPFLRAIARLPAWEPKVLELPLGREIRSTETRHQFYTVRIDGGRVEPAFKGSSAITSMANADGYVEIPAGASVLEAGTRVRVVLFRV